MATNPIPRKWTVEAYLEYEQETGIKHEYIDGEIFAMAGGTENHSLIAANGITILRTATRGLSCRTYTGDMRIKITDSKYLYPDFSLACDTPKFADDNRTMLTNPTLVAEVISDSSEKYDKITKNEYYRSLASLTYYLVIDQNQVSVQLYTAQDNGWLLQEFKQLDQIIPLNTMGVALPLNDLYADVEFQDDA